MKYSEEMKADPVYRECDFLDITPYDIFKAATKNYEKKGRCQALDYSVEVAHDSIMGEEMRMVQFNVYFSCNGKAYEEFPTFKF